MIDYCQIVLDCLLEYCYKRLRFYFFEKKFRHLKYVKNYFYLSYKKSRF